MTFLGRKLNFCSALRILVLCPVDMIWCLSECLALDPLSLAGELMTGGTGLSRLGADNRCLGSACRRAMWSCLEGRLPGELSGVDSISLKAVRDTHTNTDIIMTLFIISFTIQSQGKKIAVCLACVVWPSLSCVRQILCYLIAIHKVNICLVRDDVNSMKI